MTATLISDLGFEFQSEPTDLPDRMVEYGAVHLVDNF